jgi:flagellin
MSLTVNTNIASLSTQKWLNISTTKQTGAIEQLSSGSKINKASDDAAGLAISTKLNVKAVSLYKAIDNGNQAVAMLQTAEGGLSTVSDILTRLKELATEAASDNNATDRGSLQLERAQLEVQIGNIAQGTKYGQTVLLSGTTELTAAVPGTGGSPAVDATAALAGSAAALGLSNETVTATSTLNGTYDVDVTDNGDGSFDIVISDGGTLSESQTVDPSSAGTATFTADFAGVTMDFSTSLAAGSTTLDIAAYQAAVPASDGTPAVLGSSFTFQVGDVSASCNKVTAQIGAVDLGSLGLEGLTAWADNDAGTAEDTYLDAVNDAIDIVNAQRAKIGSYQSQINYQVSNLTITLQNTEAAASTIKDADYAKSMSDFSKYQVMTQAGVAMLAQANQMPQQVLSLLKG